MSGARSGSKPGAKVTQSPRRLSARAVDELRALRAAQRSAFKRPETAVDSALSPPRHTVSYRVLVEVALPVELTPQARIDRMKSLRIPGEATDGTSLRVISWSRAPGKEAEMRASMDATLSGGPAIPDARAPSEEQTLVDAPAISVEDVQQYDGSVRIWGTDRDK